MIQMFSVASQPFACVMRAMTYMEIALPMYIAQFSAPDIVETQFFLLNRPGRIDPKYKLTACEHPIVPAKNTVVRI